MNLLITAGNTQTPIDRVRCITNTFSGRTGASIARTAWGRGHTVTLVTSRPDALLEFGMNYRDPGERFTVVRYHTFDELATILQAQLRTTPFDAVCHAAAVSDFLSAGAFTPDQLTALGATLTSVQPAPSGQVNNDSLINTDIRFSKVFKIKERLSIEPMVEIFNLFNVANYDTLSSSLDGSIGDPNGTPKGTVPNRVGSGSGSFAPGVQRAFQFGIRVSF